MTTLVASKLYKCMSYLAKYPLAISLLSLCHQLGYPRQEIEYIRYLFTTEIPDITAAWLFDMKKESKYPLPAAASDPEITAISTMKA